MSIYLELHVSLNISSIEPPPFNCILEYEGIGTVNLNPDCNLITRVALYVLRCHGLPCFPSQTHVKIINHIPLSRGLGSSGAAVVAGCMLGNEVGNLRLPKTRLLDYCLMVERHPDNVAAALYGGFVITFLNELNPEDWARRNVPESEILPEKTPQDMSEKSVEPPIGISHYRKLRFAKEIKAVTIIPDFEVSTAKARAVLPNQYSIKDVVRID